VLTTTPFCDTLASTEVPVAPPLIEPGLGWQEVSADERPPPYFLRGGESHAL
jgi:hypothetical protein